MDGIGGDHCRVAGVGNYCRVWEPARGQPAWQGKWGQLDWRWEGSPEISFPLQWHCCSQVYAVLLQAGRGFNPLICGCIVPRCNSPLHTTSSILHLHLHCPSLLHFTPHTTATAPPTGLWMCLFHFSTPSIAWQWKMLNLEKVREGEKDATTICASQADQLKSDNNSIYRRIFSWKGDFWSVRLQKFV